MKEQCVLTIKRLLSFDPDSVPLSRACTVELKQQFGMFEVEWRVGVKVELCG